MTVAVAERVVSPWLVAVMVIVCCTAIVSGAEYKPASLIVPIPAGMIVQITAVLLVLVTLAVNC